MKKIIVGLFLLATAMGFSQKNKHEVKLDVFDVIALKTLDVAYEYALNEESSIGASLFFNFEDDRSKWFRYNEEFQFTPYFRQSFGSMFFGEVFGSLNTGENKFLVNYTDFALGLTGGVKHVTNGGFVFEAHLGGGRNLFNTDISNEFIFRGGVSIGKQF